MTNGRVPKNSERILYHYSEDSYYEVLDDKTEGNKNDVRVEQLTKKFRDLTPHSKMRVKEGTNAPPERPSLPCTIRISPEEEALADNNKNPGKNTELDVQITPDNEQTPPEQRVKTTYPCSTCEDKFDDMAFLITHQSEEHNEFYCCRCCKTHFMSS